MLLRDNDSRPLWPRIKTRFRHYVVRHRDRLLIRKLAQYCRTYLNYYDNCDYDIAVNGEFAVLNTFRTAGFTTIFDVGANHGDWAAAAASVFPQASIHCFEIVPATHEKLARRFSTVPSIVANSLGLSDAAGEISVRTYEGRSDIATIYGYPEQREAEHSIQASVVRGDDYVLEQSIEHIDFLKIDVEGAEMKVFAGLERTISAGKVSVIQFEYGQINIVAGVLLRTMCEFLETRGYVVGKIYPTGVDFRPYSLSDEDFRGPNYLAVLRSRRDLVDGVRVFDARTRH